MPPRRGIVKSGNTGNSSHSNPTATQDRPPPLFPPGFKDPWSILHERKKLGWGKPSIDIRHGKDGYTFVVTLNRHNKKTSETEIVRMQPSPPKYLPTAAEAKHWGATYALHRFCNGIQLNRVLPPGPRDYWNELVNEHQAIPEAKKWMYEADPFDAKRKPEKQMAADKMATEATRSVEKHPGQALRSSYPEVLMATSIRDLVEDAVKQGLALYPNIIETTPLVLVPESIDQLNQPLSLLGFSKNQIRNAAEFLTEESLFASILLNSLPPLEAAIEYLVLHIPECDLPQRFLPKNNLSNPFVTAVHSGLSDIKRRWVEEKATKEGGWPASVVRECTKNEECVEKWDQLLVLLGHKLLGQEIDSGITFPEETIPYEIQEDEFEAFGGQVVEPGHLIIQLFSTPIAVHVLFSNEGNYPRPGHIPIYLTSSTIPAYVRLYLISRFLETMALRPNLDDHEGFCTALMRIFEGEWAIIEDHGPPDMFMVLKHVVAPRQKFIGVIEEPVPTKFLALKMESKKRPATAVDAEIHRRFLAMQKDTTYQNILRARSQLPAFAAKDRFLNLLEKNRVVVVVGETGCGKTTQLPQIILDSLLASDCGSQASILVTQPRRLSAISIASRVSEERLNDGIVGYSIRGESKISKNTRLLFCTTGIVLRRLSTGDNLQDVSHVIVDEVHERSMDGDFLLLQLKDLLRRHPKLKVVLMSATINHEIFVKYFDSAALLMIPGFTHPVTDEYLEDILPIIDYKPPAMKLGENSKTAKDIRDDYLASGIADNAVDAIEMINRSDRIDYRLIASLVHHIMQTAGKAGGILIFLPGVGEIRQCIEAIQKAVDRRDAIILPLHANLSSSEQNKVFEPSTTSWKIIAATNVAETSITIDDVIYVIDAGKVKETRYDPETNLSRLAEVWVSRAGARQRRGRAGRTQPGICYKLYTRRQERTLAEFPIPEILRVPLENVSLSIKASKEDRDVKAFLSQAIEAPSLASIDRAWKTLVEIGAVDNDARLTALGKHLSLLPLDVRLAKMLILGTVFRCLGPIVTVVALLSTKPLFLNPLEKRDAARVARKRFYTADSDLLTDVKAFDECMKMIADGQPQSKIRMFCEDNYISTSTLREMITLRQDFVSTLSEIGFVPTDATPSSPALNASSQNVNLIKAVILGGLWPRVARIHLPKENIKFDKVSAGTVQRDNIAKDFKIYDLLEGRVFLHPGSLLFDMTNWKPPFLVYFLKQMTTKVFLRDTSKVPMYALLLFGGPVSVNHVRGGLSIGNEDGYIKVQAIPRIGILVNQLRRLFDAQLQKCIEDGTMLTGPVDNPILHAIMALLTHDGMTE